MENAAGFIQEGAALGNQYLSDEVLRAWLARHIEQLAGRAPELAITVLRRARTRLTDSTAELWKQIAAYPTLHAASLTRGGSKAGPRSSNFERGLSLLMTGLRLRHAELTAEKQKAAS